MEPPETFETKRLLIRRLVPEDAEAIFEGWAQDPVVTQYLAWRPNVSVEETLAHANRCDEGWSTGGEFTWVLVTRDSGEVVGSIAAHPAGHRVGLGYVLGRPWWGRGYMTEAVITVSRWLLAQPGCHRVGAVCDIDNERSARVLERVGFEREGTLRRWIVHPNIGDVPRDVYVYSCVTQ